MSHIGLLRDRQPLAFQTPHALLHPRLRKPLPAVGLNLPASRNACLTFSQASRLYDGRRQAIEMPLPHGFIQLFDILGISTDVE